MDSDGDRLSAHVCLHIPTPTSITFFPLVAQRTAEFHAPGLPGGAFRDTLCKQGPHIPVAHAVAIEIPHLYPSHRSGL
jgi:hypothetical protein